MAIERMKAIWLFGPRGKGCQMLDRLAAMGMVHVVDCGISEAEQRETLGLERVFPEATDFSRRVQLLGETLKVLASVRSKKKGFLENFIPTPAEVRATDVRTALAELDEAKVHGEVKALDRQHKAVHRQLQQARANLKALAPLEGVSGVVPGHKAQHNVAAFLGTLSHPRFKELQADERLPDDGVLALGAQKGRLAIVQAAVQMDKAEEMESLLAEYGFERVEPEPETVAIAEYIEHRRKAISGLELELKTVVAALDAATERWFAQVEMALGYWEERLRTAETARLLAESKRLTIVRGYVREKDLDAFRKRIAADLPEATLDVRDPQSGENVPISLKNNRLFAPASFLVGMFGMPNYFTFDPTMYIVTSFLIFFGFCFGDAVYGILMGVLGLLLARKYRAYAGPRTLFRLLALAGIPTFIVGVLTGAWASDLFSAQYVGDGNPLTRLIDNPFVFDMIKRSLVALGIALMLGVINQFLSLICLMVRRVREGSVSGALFDGGFWLMVLPAVVVAAAGLFAKVPSGLSRTIYGMAAIGAVGLVLTQGRHEKSFVAKAAVGVVSLYGIVGSYGITAFIGDILSYSRLLALGLTTSIVGMCFNLIGGLARDMAGGIPALGLVLFVLVVLLGHSMNFLIGILGAFVHSARLIFVEFFGKFYQGDAIAFAPLGTWAGRIRVVDSRTVWEK